MNHDAQQVTAMLGPEMAYWPQAYSEILGKCRWISNGGLNGKILELNGGFSIAMFDYRKVYR